MPTGSKSSSQKGLKICCGTTLILLIIFVVVSVTLFLTLFKPKQPQIVAHPASLENINITIFPFSLNATLGLIVTINNPNRGSFKYRNTTAYVSYHGITVAQVPIEHQLVPSRGKLNISTYAIVRGDKLISSPHFWEDVAAGSFNFTSMATLHGKVSVLKIFKLGAAVFSTCDISIMIQTQALDSKCTSKIKL